MEPAALTWIKMECAQMRSRQGVPVETIAVELDTSVEQVQQWLGTLQHTGEKLTELYRRQLFNKRCAKCGNLIPEGTTYSDTGADSYHSECWRKICYGS